MAILQNLLRSSKCSKRLLLLTSSRCLHGLHSQQSPAKCPVADQNYASCNFISSVRHNIVKKTHSQSLLQKIDFVLPMSPVEQLIKFQLPAIAEQVSLEMPTTKVSLDNAHINQKVVEYKAPTRGRVVKQQALPMSGIVMKKRKMKKHKRRKYLKKYRILLTTLAQKRKVARETVFLTGVEQQLKAAEAFSAEDYAAAKIKKAFAPLPAKEVMYKPLPWEFQPLFYNSQKKKNK